MAFTSLLRTGARLCLRRTSSHFLVESLSTRIISEAEAVQQHCSQPVKNFCTKQQVTGEKGHAVLAPFTAAHQVAETNPLIIERSEGAYVFDSNGKKYLDTLAGLWCTSLGGHQPRLVTAAMNQMNKLPFYHSFWNRITKPALELSKEILDLFTPAEMSKVFFTNDGSEANDTQVKLVWYYNNALGRPNKKKIIARHKAYHGSTLVAASLTGLGNLHQSFDLPLPFVLHTDCPHYWRYGNSGGFCSFYEYQ